MYKVYIKTFEDKEETQIFHTIEQSILCFLRHLGGRTHKVELHENVGHIDKPFYRFILDARRAKEGETFIINRVFNIF